MALTIDPVFYRSADELVVEPTALRRVLAVGSCLATGWVEAARISTMPCAVDHLWISTSAPTPPRPIEEYDFQIVQLPLRFLVHDSAFARLAHDDLAGHRALFRTARERLRQWLAIAMHWNRERGLLSFVVSFPTPQQNPAGRLLPRYDLRNFVHFVERLNQALEHELAAYRNAYLFDIDQVVSTHGRRFFQDDVFWAANHAAYIHDFDSVHDGQRLEAAPRISEAHELRIMPILSAAWAELVGLYRTVRQSDQVKMVVVDLDDTLWRGVIAELTPDTLPTTEGWPLGLWEALSFLRRRGILLGIISRNDEARVREVWETIFRGRLALEDFAVRKIGFGPKPEAMAEILQQVNLLPRSVVYIDDNPAERAAMLMSFPDIRILGGAPYDWRRILLWAPETQTAAITAESAARTAMVQAQVVREEQRNRLSREEFLLSLGVRVEMLRIDGTAHPRFPRALELINKTNQFNTTGRRWTLEECEAAFAAGAAFHAFEAADVFTPYGLVGVAVTEGASISQFVMSCRVMGLEVERAAVAAILAGLRRAGPGPVTAMLVETERNLPCRDLWQGCGFTPGPEGLWQAPASLAAPAHVTLAEAAELAPA